MRAITVGLLIALAGTAAQAQDWTTISHGTGSDLRAI